VLKAEKVLLKHQLPNDIIPTPKDISSECGMSIRIDGETVAVDEVKAVLSQAGLRFSVHSRINI